MKNLGLYDNDLSMPRKQDVDEKQTKIDAVGILQGNGDGSVSAAETATGVAMSIPSGILKGEDGALAKAQPGTDYADSTLGIIGATVGKVVSIKSVDGAGQPTAYGAVDASGSGDSNVFVITLTSTNSSTISADKTQAEIDAAVAAGKYLYVLYYQLLMPVTSISYLDDQLMADFSSGISDNGDYGVAMLDAHGEWTFESKHVAVYPTISEENNGKVLFCNADWKTGKYNYGWTDGAIGTQIATDFTGIIKGASGKLAQAEAGTDYMSPVPVENTDNGKIMQVVDGAWSASEPVNTTVALTESWIFTLADGSTVIKKVVVSGD